MQNPLIEHSAHNNIQAMIKLARLDHINEWRVGCGPFVLQTSRRLMNTSCLSSAADVAVKPSCQLGSRNKPTPKPSKIVRSRRFTLVPKKTSRAIQSRSSGSHA